VPTLSLTNIRKALYGKLAGDTTLVALLGAPPAPYNKSIYYELAPGNARFPYVIFQKQSGVPTYAMVNGSSAYEEDLWLFKGVDHKTTADDAEAVAQRIDVLLQDATLSISGATLMYLRRESGISYMEVDSGERYEHAGASYRLIFS
jgi:hypothetical protein